MTVQHPGDDSLMRRHADNPGTVEARLVILGIGGRHQIGRSQQRYLENREMHR